MSLLLKLCVALMVILFAGEVVVLGAARLTYHDPFAPYTAIMPGQSFDAVADYPCPPHVGMTSGVEAGFCQFEAEDGIFGRVTVVESDHVIKRTSFAVLPDGLHLGDLILCWGKPTEVVNIFPSETLSLDMYWGNQFSARVIGAQFGTRPDYFLPVSDLSIIREWQSTENKELASASYQ